MHEHAGDDLHTKLEPIHYRMYEKVLAVDALAREMAAFGDRRGWTQGAAARLDQAHPRICGELADHVEFPWVHDGIAALVAAADTALDAACEPLEGHLDELTAYARELGAQAARAMRPDGTLRDAWSAMDAHWLDGMPCDGRVRLLSETPDAIAWRVDLAPHTGIGYARIRDAWTAGFMEAAGIGFSREGDGTYRIERAA